MFEADYTFFKDYKQVQSTGVIFAFVHQFSLLLLLYKSQSLRCESHIQMGST